MTRFLETTHLSQILEKSNKQAVMIFKYSNECGSSDRLKESLKKKIEAKTLNLPIYLVIVQIHKALSEKIAQIFNTKHESPQILIINKGKVVYTAHHGKIKIENFVLE